jgi:hypothetical protein
MDLDLENKGTNWKGWRTKLVKLFYAFISIDGIIIFSVKIWSALMIIHYFIPWFSPFEAHWDYVVDLKCSKILSLFCHWYYCILMKYRMFCVLPSYQYYTKLSDSAVHNNTCCDCSVGHKSIVGFTGLQSRCGQVVPISGHSRRLSVSLLFGLLAYFTA